MVNLPRPTGAGSQANPLFFSPGGGVIHEHNFLQAEELASRGYVVVSLSHPYESWAVIFPDGRVARATELKAKTAKTQEDKDREKKSQDLAPFSSGARRQLEGNLN